MRRLIVGISGASGAIVGIRLLEALQKAKVETCLIVSKSALLTIAGETDYTAKQVLELADVTYNVSDIGAAVASGSFKTDGMIIAPCSIRSLSEISSGITSSLLTRAADVVLKERRKLVLAVRETPLHLGHLRSMAQVTEMGAIVAPIMPAFYARPKSIDEMVNHFVGRLLDHFDIDSGLVRRWGEDIGLNQNSKSK